MLQGENVRVRVVKGLDKIEMRGIKDFLQGSVYCWCKNRKGEWFSARELLGGDNFHWQGTPLMVLYKRQKEINKSSSEAVTQAGKDVGNILKNVLSEDRRVFRTEEGYTRRYIWDGRN